MSSPAQAQSWYGPFVDSFVKDMMTQTLFIFMYVCGGGACVCMCMCVTVQLWRSGATFRESVLAFYLVVLEVMSPVASAVRLCALS